MPRQASACVRLVSLELSARSAWFICVFASSTPAATPLVERPVTVTFPTDIRRYRKWSHPTGHYRSTCDTSGPPSNAWRSRGLLPGQVGAGRGIKTKGSEVNGVRSRPVGRVARLWTEKSFADPIWGTIQRDLVFCIPLSHNLRAPTNPQPPAAQSFMQQASTGRKMQC